MSQGATSRPAYKVEELLALRASASGSTVSLEKFPDEDVIKGRLRSSDFTSYQTSSLSTFELKSCYCEAMTLHGPTLA
jgi:hypothetical protein